MNMLATARHILSFAQWLRVNDCVRVEGSWEFPVFEMSEESIDKAFAWLASGNETPENKADWVYENILKECDNNRLAAIYDALTVSDVRRIKREYVLDLIATGGHAHMLCEMAWGPDTRPTQADIDREHNENYERAR